GDGTDVEVRASDNWSRRRQADATADGLREPDPAVTDFGLRLDHGELDGGERDLLRLELGPVTDQAPARLAIVDDLAALDVDPGAKLDGLSHPLTTPSHVQLRDPLGPS